MKLIPLTQGKFAQVDDEDFEWLSRRKWHYHHTGYATTHLGHGTFITMHRLILGLKAGDALKGDHINGDGLDNQRNNLRKCTNQQNCFNQRLLQKNKSGFKGVSFHRGKWRAVGCIGKRQYFLGYFNSKTEAALAYDKFALKHFGEFARTNNMKGLPV